MCNRHQFRVGLCAIGLEAYWSQFNGLERRLTGYLDRLVGGLAQPGVQVVDLGLVDTPQRSREAGRR